MGIITDYLNLQKKHSLQYGERTVVLIQVGSFYEIYGYSPEYCASDDARVDKEGNVWNEAIGLAVELSVVLNSVLTYENSSDVYSVNNCHKIGFPLISYEKNRDTLLANDYVIIRVDQEKGAKSAKGPVARFVAEICSPTMQLDHITLTRPTSNIACIYIEYQQGIKNRYENFLVTTGAAVVDIITGQNRVCEFHSKVEDQVHAVQELYRFLIAHYPRELIVHITDMPAGLDQHGEDNPNPYVKYLEKVLELRRFDRLTTAVNKVPTEYRKIPYQVEFLNKIFTKQLSQTQGISLNIVQKRNERIIEDMGLELMNYGRIAHMILLQHCHSHNPDIIVKLAKPDIKWIDENKHLVLTHNAIVQLDLVPANDSSSRLRKKTEIDSLMTILDQNQTHLGRRALHTLLQNPMLDPTEIQTYYNMVDEMSVNVTGNEPLWSVLDRQLKELPDIGRLQRKLEIKLITPKELAVLYRSYLKIINIYITILNTKVPTLHGQMFTQEDVASFNEFISRFGAIINFEALECCHIDTSAESTNRWLEFVDCPIKSGLYPNLDDQTQTLVSAETNLQHIVDHLNGFLSHTKGKKIEFKTAKKKQGATKKDPTGTLLATTAAKASSLVNASIDTNLCGNIQVMPYTASDRIITSDRIAALCSYIDNTRTWMRQTLLNIYESILEEMSTKYNFYVAVASLIAKLDLIHSYAKVSARNNYHRPELVAEDGVPSYLEAREVRHPIIERIIDGAYVANDVFLGNGSEQHNRSNGMLLFGVNQTGKSSLAKAIALIIIMAQAGCFTPSLLKYKPYSKIITRLSGSDNIFKGQSSFAVEMTELRTILRQSNASTLVIGDELAKGTESMSATGITVATLRALIKSRSSFVFATHMHHIVDMPCISELDESLLKVAHLSVVYDEKLDSLIYNRKLQAGPGSPIYGLMVARGLGLPLDFINDAHQTLLYLGGNNDNVLEPIRSRYNGKIYIDSCAMCNKSRAQTALHTHHIIEQKDADEKGIVTKDNAGRMHKNAKDNLIVLCEQCHTNLHRRKEELETLDTGNGKIIRVRPESPGNLLIS